MTKNLFSKPSNEISVADLNRLIDDKMPESLYLDYKEDLSEKGGNKGPGRRSVWDEKREITERARNELTDAMIGFANADGGTLLLGIAETSEKPPRPERLAPLADVAELASRIRQALGTIIDPPLSSLDVAPVSTTADGSGVVLLRTPSSPQAPHARKDGKALICSVRRGDEGKQMTMYEVREMVIQRESMTRRIEERFAHENSSFREVMAQYRTARPTDLFLGFQFVLMPASGTKLVIDIPRTFSVPQGIISRRYNETQSEDFAKSGEVLTLRYSKPVMGGRASFLGGRPDENEFSNNFAVEYRWQRDGSFRARVAFRATMPQGDSVPSISEKYLTPCLADGMQWIDQVRVLSGNPNLSFDAQIVIDNLHGMNLSEPVWGDLRGRPFEKSLSQSSIYEIEAGENADEGVTALCQDFFDAFGASDERVQYSYRNL